MHLDLWVEDFPSAYDRVMSLGAKVLKPAEETDSVDNFQVYADPAGHPFCLCWIDR
jgi:predicted enzyme related to lactoylglutathione lyase